MNLYAVARHCHDAGVGSGRGRPLLELEQPAFLRSTSKPEGQLVSATCDPYATRLTRSAERAGWSRRMLHKCIQEAPSAIRCAFQDYGQQESMQSLGTR